MAGVVIALKITSPRRGDWCWPLAFARARRCHSAFRWRIGQNVATSIATLVIVLAGTCAAFAQQTVRGTVTDQLGAVVKGAKVTLKRGDTSAGEKTTDGAGAFTFSAVAEGRYHLQVDAAEFATYNGPEVFVGSNLDKQRGGTIT